MVENPCQPAAFAGPDRRRRVRRGAILASAAAVVLLGVPALAGVPARLVRGCGTWIAAGGGLELLSGVGFVLVFKLVFAAPDGWRRSVPAALRALGASAILPGGGLVGAPMSAMSTHPERSSLSQLTRSATTFTILTNAPGVVTLAAVGLLLRIGVVSGPRQTALTVLPAVAATGLFAAVCIAARICARGPAPAERRPRVRRLARPLTAIGGGAADARTLVAGGDWKLAGTLAYYALDNAALWAAFRAFGDAPPIGVLVMGYLVGSLAGALPVPAGLGVTEGGLTGALILYGLPAAPTAAAVLLYRSISLAMPVALGAVGAVWRPGPSRAHEPGGAPVMPTSSHS
jgi:uncharacterized membrane protein YbhN (UPF0104 family)